MSLTENYTLLRVEEPPRLGRFLQPLACAAARVDQPCVPQLGAMCKDQLQELAIEREQPRLSIAITSRRHRV